MTQLSIVILNYNGRKHLQQFLPQVIEHSKDYEIVIADNASTDDSISFLQTNYPEIRLIKLTQNGGFAKGYNDALTLIDSEYYLLLNSDVEVTQNWITPLLDHLIENPLTAGVQPKIKSYLQKDSFEHAGACGGFIDRNYFPFCRGRIISHCEKDTHQYNNIAEVFWATGAALLIRSSVYKKVNGFDERFFAHMEEIDMCWRIKQLGYNFVVIPQSTVYHLGGGTLPYSSPFKTYLNFRNSLFMITKNHNGWLFPKLFWRLCIDGIAGINFFFKGEVKNTWMIIKSHFALYAKMSELLKDRKYIKQQRTTSNLTGFYRGNILWAYYFKRIRKFSDLNQRLFEKY